MKIIIGADHLGFELKKILKAYLQEKGIEVVDAGTYSNEPVDYPDIALAVAEKIAAGEYPRGILICGTGIGMAIAANKVPGVRAAQCHDIYSAERARKSNNAQIITLGSLVVGPELAKKLIDVWVESEFQGGRSLPKVEKIDKIDRKYRMALREIATEGSSIRCCGKGAEAGPVNGLHQDTREV
ncbi:Ribose 5-phosphate isomerase B [Moorella glycerini]|uniref:Ribose-5-phosphate isomerase B n=1 Tax=Neomoorella stamsii TaxID=1266720 RepID=A0A9X7J5G6_9FIRM|nr:MULTISPECIES: ribose 5-phosphate isomerase B [Moorella]PRR77512.1 Ribose-5-phosphate isomerase B [Moorella stamsii]CEP68261.1 Ribose 5-phosphate isomerase B [Moorella glycerini]